MTSMQDTESKSHSVFNAYMSLTVVDDIYTLNTECDLDSVSCILVIDKYAGY